MPYPFPSMMTGGVKQPPHLIAGTSNYLVYSGNGTTWTKYGSTFAGSNTLYGIAWDGNRRTIALTATSLARSDDNGRTWTSYAFSVTGTAIGSISGQQCGAITYAFGAWWIFAPNFANTDFCCWKSTDGGLTWTFFTTIAGSIGPLLGIARTSGRLTVFANLGGVAGFLTTTDCTTWAATTFGANGSGMLTCTDAVTNIWLGIGNSTTGRQLIKSTNGTTYSNATSIASGNYIDVAWSPRLGLFLVHASSGRIWTSPDATTFTAQTPTGLAADLEGVAWSGSVFVGVGTDNVIYTSPNGIAWTAQTTPATLNYVAPCNRLIV